jgi:hypothetical protein
MAAASIRNNGPGDRRVTAVHIALGAAVVAVNLAAGAWGAWAWWQERTAPGFWPLLRAGQALVVVQAVVGGVLLLAGEDLPPLHLVYGLTPLAVAFFAEQLRIVAAQSELDKRGLAGRDDVAALSDEDQRRLVRAIVRREIGVMAASALVVGFLGVRASEWL